MKAYLKVIAVFMVGLILIGSVFGWNLTSFDTAKNGLQMFLHTVNSIGQSTIKSIRSLGSSWGLASELFTPIDYSLPFAYKSYLTEGEKGSVDLYYWYVEAFKIYYGVSLESPDREAIREFAFCNEYTVHSLYHMDLLYIVQNYDTWSNDCSQQRNRIYSQKFFALFAEQWRYVFFFDDVKKEYQAVLDSCTIEGCHEFETPEDIIIHFEFGG